MSNNFDLLITKEHEQAIVIAEHALKTKGFQRIQDFIWEGYLQLNEHGDISIKLELPSKFPYMLPQVFIDYRSLDCVIPHVDTEGRICTVETTGIMFNSNRPEDLVNEVLEKARQILINGLSKKNVYDIADEFEAYWGRDINETYWLICNDITKSKNIECFNIKRLSGKKTGVYLFTNSLKEAKVWTENLGVNLGEKIPGFIIQLTEMFIPLKSDAVLTFSELLNILQKNSLPETYESFVFWLDKVKLPVYVLFVLPLRENQISNIFGVKIEDITVKEKHQFQKGFRPDKITAFHVLQRKPEHIVNRLNIQRLDPQYILPRGGAHLNMSQLSVSVIGCGAVGSYIIDKVASLGVGSLHLVDADKLTNENIYRHVLGVSSINSYKAKAMAEMMGKRFPHLHIEYRTKLIEDLIKEEPSFITDTDLLIIAIGEPTIEFLLNQLLGHLKPRIHVWLEPLGIGGHILATALSKKQGCYHCIYEDNEQWGLMNRASLAAPGQKFHRTMAGCAGQFVPFSALDAERIAGEAVRLAYNILTQKETEPVLITIQEESLSFIEAGYQLSNRAKKIPYGVRHRELGYVRSDCPICSGWVE